MLLIILFTINTYLVVLSFVFSKKYFIENCLSLSCLILLDSLHHMVITRFYTNWSILIKLEKAWDAIKLVGGGLKYSENGWVTNNGRGEVLINGGGVWPFCKLWVERNKHEHEYEVMLILILINVQYSKKAVFSFENSVNGQNHSSSGSHYLVKKNPSKISNPPPILYHYLEKSGNSQKYSI